MNKTPLCIKCGNKCSPSGGNTQTGETKFWSCWNCDEHTNDVDHESINKLIELKENEKGL